MRRELTQVTQSGKPEILPGLCREIHDEQFPDFEDWFRRTHFHFWVATAGQADHLKMKPLLWPMLGFSGTARFAATLRKNYKRAANCWLYFAAFA